MSGADERGSGRRYTVLLSVLILVVVGLAGTTLFLASGGSLLGRGAGVFGISETPALDATLRRARQAAWSGAYDTALAAFDTVVTAVPDDRSLAVERARVLGWAQRYDEAAAALAAVEDTADVETTLERARYLWWASRPLEADSLLSELLERHPDMEEARALQDLVRPSIEPDVDVAQRWVAERPEDPFTHLWLARAMVEASRTAESLEHYRTAIGESGTVEPDVLLEAAGVALGVDSLQYAGELLLRYVHDVDPSDWQTRLRLARAYAWSGRWDAAEEQYRRVLDVVDSPDVRLELARLLVDRGRYEAALPEYRRVLASRPSLTARRELASALAQAERYAAAVQELDRVIEEDPDPSLLVEQAELLALMERYGEAADVLGRAIALLPEAHDLRLRRARLLWWSGRLAEADAELTELLAARPDHQEATQLREDIRNGIDASVDLARTWVELDDTPRNQLRLARVLTARKRYAEALPRYRVVLADSTSRELVVEAVEVAEAADSLDAATALLEAHLDEAAADRELMLHLARLHGWAGRPDRAAAVYAGYLDRYPGDTRARFERAQQLAWQDSAAWDTAVVELDRVVAADPDHAEALKLLGDINQWQGQPDQALAYYRRAQAVDPELEGLDKGIELAMAMTEADAAQDATYVAWASEMDAFTDSEEFGWVATDAQRNWKLDRRTTLGLRVGQRYSRGNTLAGSSEGSLGLEAGVVGGYHLGDRVTGELRAGVASYADVGTFATAGARIEYSDSSAFGRIQYDRSPAAREATTMAALQAEAIVHRFLLRTLYGLGDWQAAADLQLQAFRADVGNTTRYAGTVRVDRPVGSSGLTVGALVRGIYATGPAPTYPDWGPLLWAPVRYVAPALSVSYGTPVGGRWWVGLRASPGYAWIEERSTGIARYESGETAILETGATVGYRNGPWSLSISGDWGGALPEGYRASTLKIELSRIGIGGTP